MAGSTDNTFREWAILELMGHRRLGGFLTACEIAGAVFLRLDVPGEDGPTKSTQLYAPAAVYAITPTTEAVARAVASRSDEAPVTRFELPAPTSLTWPCPQCTEKLTLREGAAEVDGVECWGRFVIARDARSFALTLREPTLEESEEDDARAEDDR